MLKKMHALKYFKDRNTLKNIIYYLGRNKLTYFLQPGYLIFNWFCHYVQLKL